MSDIFLLALAAIAVVFILYWPVMRLAREDMVARSRAGMGNGVIYAILLLPLLGPLIYLLLRRALLP